MRPDRVVLKPDSTNLKSERVDLRSKGQILGLRDQHQSLRAHGRPKKPDETQDG